MRDKKILREERISKVKISIGKRTSREKDDVKGNKDIRVKEDIKRKKDIK